MSFIIKASLIDIIFGLNPFYKAKKKPFTLTKNQIPNKIIIPKDVELGVFSHSDSTYYFNNKSFVYLFTTHNINAKFN